MELSDDREEFARFVENQSIELGKDKAVFSDCIRMLTTLDKYDYSYLWSWMGVPIIQLPADILATGEAIWACKPDIIIESGVARGGSLIFMASILKALGKGRVIGVDIDIRKHNEETIRSHPLSDLIELIEGDSVSEDTLLKVKSHIWANARVMVVLDSNHSKSHVLKELEIYGKLVSAGCYLIVADTFLGFVGEEDTPRNRSQILFKGDEPLAALNTYLETNDQFRMDQVINGKLVLASSPGGYLIKDSDESSS